MLNAFKIKEFDLQPIYEEWKDGPMFNGNKKDLPVEEWLDKIKEGCEKRKVPEQYWYKVAQHFMGPKARARLEELKQVIAKVHGAKYRWTWKKFRVAMLNMGWSIDMDKKETIKIQGRSSGMWFTRKKDSDTPCVSDLPQDPPPQPSESTTKKPRPAPSRSGTLWFSNKSFVDEPSEEPEPEAEKKPIKAATAARRRPSRSATISNLWTKRTINTEQTKDDLDMLARPEHRKARSETVVSQVNNHKQTRSLSRSRTGSEGGEVVATTGSENQEVITTKAEAPAWLLNACTALEYITSEHPRAMSIVSAILITAGSIPAIPAIAAGAGGAVLASSTAHAIGAMAIAAGQALGAGVVSGQRQTQPNPGSIVEHN